ncbi:MAG: ATP-binding protein [Acidimicrobiales bacterium]
MAITQATRQNLIQQVDEQLARSTPEGRGERRPDADDDGYPTPGTTPPGAIAVVALRRRARARADDLVTVSRPNLLTSSEAILDLHGDEAARHVGGEPFTVGAEDGDLSFRVQVGLRAPTVASPCSPCPDRRGGAIRRLLLIQAAAAAAILGTLRLVTFWVLRLGVRPVREMTHTAMAIGEGDLSQRIPETAPGTEAGELGLASTRCSGRIEEAFDERSRSEDRLRQFVAGASHELHRHHHPRLRRALPHGRPRRADRARRGDAPHRAGSVAHGPAGGGPARPRPPRPGAPAPGGAGRPRRARRRRGRRPARRRAGPPGLGGGRRARGDRRRRGPAPPDRRQPDHQRPGPHAAGTPIHLRARPDQAGGAVLEVADEGPGMASDVAARAFERFYRADPARPARPGGSGLGLSIVAGTVAAHGGHVELDSAPGRGTCVRIALPAVPPTAPPADPDAGADGPDGR